MAIERMVKDSIRIAVGYRIYELFCVDCNAILMDEDEALQQMKCSNCGRLYAYRMQKEKEEACLEYMMQKPKIQ